MMLPMSLFTNITSQERVDFTKNLAVMLKSGVTINESLNVLAEQSKSGAFRRIIQGVQREIEKGIPLSEAFAKEEKVFGAVSIALLRAGEASGTLEENLSFLADWLERNHDLREEINAATLYPKIVLAVALILGGGLAVFILPRLVPLFEQLQVELPLPTRILLASSVFIQQYWFLVLAIGIAAIIIFILLNRLRPVRRFLHLLYIKTPFLGSLLVDYQLALISQLLSTLLRSGLPIRESINITAGAATNLRYAESVRRIRERVEKGTTLSSAMQAYPQLYPKSMVSIIATGEKSGALDDSFVYLTEYYSKQVQHKTKKLPLTLEPILLVLIALVVGFVAISIIMPIYELTGSIGR